MLKTASDLTNFEVCEEELFKIIMSTGMSTIHDIQKVQVFKRKNRRWINTLHCVSSYPMDINSARLVPFRYKIHK